MLTTEKPETSVIACPSCGLILQTHPGSGSAVTINYDVRAWQRHCETLKLGTPCLCPPLRPQLHEVLGRPGK